MSQDLTNLFLQLCRVRFNSDLFEDRPMHFLNSVQNRNFAALYIDYIVSCLIYALNVLASVVPDWLRDHLKTEWGDRYRERVEEYRLPKEKGEGEALLKVIGKDGQELIENINQAEDLPWLKGIPAI